MTRLNEVYKCTVCGNMAEVVHAKGGQMVCCGKLMELKAANTVDAGKEKHIPVIEKKGSTITIKVGSIPHPMEEAHHIEWIELVADDKVYRKHLKAGDKPEAVFNTGAKKFTARAYCNLHGLWSA